MTHKSDDYGFVVLDDDTDVEAVDAIVQELIS
jgi:hypothetical protein